MARRFVLPAVLACLLATPVAAHAGSVTIGSDLTGQATLTQSHNIDWAAWPGSFATGGGVVAPVHGEVTMVDLKGTVLKPTNDSAYGGRYPPFNFLVIVLRPQPGGGTKFMVATPDLVYPFGKSPDTITSINMRDYNAALCVRPGDHVAIATSGGFGNTDPAFGGFPDNFYEEGYPVQMFARMPGSSYSLFEQQAVGGDDGNGFQVGDVENGTQQAGQELLMRTTISTGDDARFSCQTAEEKQAPTVSVADQARDLRASAGNVDFQVRCDSLRRCPGTLYLKNGTAIVGEGKFALAGRSTGAVRVTLNANGARKLRESGGRLPVTAVLRPEGGTKVEQGGFVIVGGGGEAPGSPVATPVKPKSALRVRSGKVALQVRCDGTAACAGKLALSKQGAFLGSARFAVPAGSARSVAVKLNSKARQALRKAKGPAISAKATAKTADGAKSVIFKIKRA